MKKEKLNLNRIPYPVWFFLILLNFVLIIFIVFPSLESQGNIQNSTLEILPSSTPSPTNSVSPEQEESTPIISEPKSQSDLVVFLTVYKNLKNQIYVYFPGNQNITRLFTSPYEEIDPVINQTGTKLAYSAKKNGYWDLYVFDLESKQELRITDTAEYEGKPAWSPDGEFLAYTKYQNGNLDIYIQSISDLSSAPIQLTDDPAADFSPVWSPSGREIAFVSTRSGDQEIWIAQLNVITDRFSNISNRPDFQDNHPNWLPNSEILAWSGEKNGEDQIIKADITSPTYEQTIITQGKFFAFTGSDIVTIHETANQTFLSIEEVNSNHISTYPIALPGSVSSVQTYQDSNFSGKIAGFVAENPAISFISGLDENETLLSENALSRSNIVTMDNVNAPYTYMNENVIASFNMLRIDTANLAGWDFMSDLEEAFLPLTNPNDPGLDQDWAYTGRSFRFNPLTIYADLVTVIREDHNGSTYWRIYIKARYQDGSQGLPLMQTPWNLDARYENDPKTYETGGFYGEIPEGYWIDFTQIVWDHGWNRLSALSNWKQYFNAALFNQIVYAEGLDWSQAIQEIYPIESINSPTPVPSITMTPTLTATVRFFRSPTATLTPTETPIPTRRPTWTPNP